MTCQNFREMISLYIDNKLDKNEIRELETHLKDCSECMKEYEDLKTIKNLLADTPKLPLPDGFKDELHQKLVSVKDELESVHGDMEVITYRDKQEKNKNWRKKFNWKLLSAAAAVILLMIISVSGLNNFMMGPKFQQEQAQEALPREAGEENMTNMDTNYGIMQEKSAPEVAEAPSEDIALTNEAKLDTRDNNYVAEQKDEIQKSEIKEIPKTKTGRKIILNGYMHIDTEDYDKTQENIIKFVISKGGFIQSSYTSYKIYNRDDPEKSLKSGNLTLRVPQKEFHNIYNEIQALGNVVDERIDSNDITKQYRDIYNEVENLKIQEKRLREILDKAENVKEILEVERELNRVRGDINRLTGNLKNWDDLVDLSTIEVDLNEITLRDKQIQSIDEDNICGKAKKGFIKTTNRMINLMETLFVAFISYIPIILVLALISLFGYWIIRKLLKK